MRLFIFSDKIPQEKMGKDLLDMSQYKQVFGTCRQPFDKKDKLVFNLQSKHIVVVSNNLVSMISIYFYECGISFPFMCDYSCVTTNG